MGHETDTKINLKMNVVCEAILENLQIHINSPRFTLFNIKQNNTSRTPRLEINEQAERELLPFGVTSWTWVDLAQWYPRQNE